MDRVCAVPRSRLPAFALSALVVVSLIVRAYDLEHIPANFGGDEGHWAMESLAMLQDGLADPFATRRFSFPSLSYLAWGGSMAIFGESVSGLRALSAVLGAAAVPATFLLARELFGRRVAWFAAMALAFGHYHLHFSRIGLNNVGDALLVSLALWLLVRGLRRGTAGWLAWSGAVVGLGWYGYFGSRLIGLIVLAFVACRALAERGFLKRHARDILTMVAAAVTVAAPLLVHYIAHPHTLFERSGQVSIFGSGWLAAEMAITGRSAADLLLRQLWQSALAFNYSLDPTYWYRPGIPLLDVVSGALFVLGMVRAATRLGQPANNLLLAWFWPAILTGWVMTENPPSSQRLLIVTPALGILVGLGLDWIVARLTKPRQGLRWRGQATAATVLVLIVALNTYHYFWVYTPARVYGNPTAEVTTILGRYLAAQEDHAVVYFHGAPAIYWNSGTLRFLCRHVDGLDVLPPTEGVPPGVDRSRPMRSFFLPSRLAELGGVVDQYSGGTESRVASAVDGRLLYVMYEVDAAEG
jgi:4-amino-4-deoxy-L-arabinose transferase-like glycosyltransferase